MEKFRKFYFQEFKFDNEKLEATFFYNFDKKVFFEEKVYFFNNDFKKRENLDENIINNFLFNTHIALWISYYKAFPTNKLIIESWFLSKSQVVFWKKFYKNWLAEFLYRNKISPDNLFNFIVNSEEKYEIRDFNISKKSLISLGWWKDSLVSIDLFEKSKISYDLFVFWKNDNIKQGCADLANKKILLVKRKLSEKLIELNNDWYYNWHVPITWIIAFVQILTAYIYDYKYLVLSNEKSASSWNIEWNWLRVNHQYSKSLEFEIDFKNYVEDNITHNIKYFSLLRWVYEQKISKYFSLNCKRYFDLFSSCNNNFNINENKRLKWKKWCNNCPKCAFVFVILRPYLENSEIKDIFWEDLFYKKQLENVFLELLWLTWIKPFECVWEQSEVIYSMNKSLEKYDPNNLPEILKIFVNKIKKLKSVDFFTNLEKKLDEIYNDDIIPKNIKNKVIKNNFNEK